MAAGNGATVRGLTRVSDKQHFSKHHFRGD
jgi:hypothetical protein